MQGLRDAHVWRGSHSTHPSLLPSSIYLPKLLPCPASHPQMSLLCLVVLLPASPFHALPPSQRKNTRCFSGCLLQRSSQQELTSFCFSSCPAREGSGGGAAPPHPGGSTKLSEPKQASANTPTQERTSPLGESSSQADDRWELAICVTEVPRSQPRLTQLCPQRHWDPPWGTPGCPLAERLQAGASGQPVPPRCSRCSFS